MFSSSQFTQALKSEAQSLGFSLVGACPAVPAIGFDSLLDWLDSGYAGEMEYLRKRVDAYRHPEGVLPGVVSLLMLGLNYKTCEASHGVPGTGRVSRYAWGKVDYHDLIRKRLSELEVFVHEQFHACKLPDAQVRGVIDTAPLLEREFAQLAGLGWRGKNTMLIRPQFGSWFFIAGLLLSVELEYDQPFTANHCGTCTACLDQCPTKAFPEPGVLDATKCISYLTIEHRSAIEHRLRPQIGDWILGCDICQEVCPWNRKAPVSREADFFPIENQNPVPLRELFFLSDTEFRTRFRKTPLWRPKRSGLLRNAAIALGNYPHAENLPALKTGLHDDESLIRGACAWAIGQHKFPESKQLLSERSSLEQDPVVHEEIECGLQELEDL